MMDNKELTQCTKGELMGEYVTVCTELIILQYVCENFQIFIYSDHTSEPYIKELGDYLDVIAFLINDENVTSAVMNVITKRMTAMTHPVNVGPSYVRASWV